MAPSVLRHPSVGWVLRYFTVIRFQNSSGLTDLFSHEAEAPFPHTAR
jgi:hypothetical protein